MKVKLTERGFEIVEFEDSNGHVGSLQQSSAIDDTERGMQNPGSSFLWIGHPGSRLHLSRELVKELAEMMLRWAETGSMEGGGK